MRRWQRFCRIVVLIVVLLSGLSLLHPHHSRLERAHAVPAAMAQSVPSHSPAKAPQAKGAPVRLDGNTLFVIQTATANMSVAQRAQIANQEINRIARDDSTLLDKVVTEPRQDVVVIVEIAANEERKLIITVTPKDAEAAQKPLEELAQEWRRTIQSGIQEYRTTHSQRRLTFAIAATGAATLVLIIVIKLINKVAALIHRYLGLWWEHRTHPLQFQNLVIFTPHTQTLLLQHLTSILRWSLIVVCGFSHTFIVTFFFPQTEKIGQSILTYLLGQLSVAWSTGVNFLPNLFVIIIVLLVARFLLRASKLIFDALETGRVSWPGFYPDWSQPTHHMITLLIWAASLAIIFPYLPGSTSPAVQGLGILAGALLTVGGAGTVASLISGYVIIFSRPFQVGDLIAFDDYKGFVHQKSVLATQIRSLNGEILTIPNATLQSKTIINYSAIIRDLNAPLALTTTLTLGYDVPWRQIHRVLVEAALATPKILSEPPPCVLQTSLDDFYVSYMLKVFTDKPEFVLEIYSELLQNLQDHCAAAGIEIMSPHYRAVRNGNQHTIPPIPPTDYTLGPQNN